MVSPFEPPGADTSSPAQQVEIGAARAALGIVLCLYSIGLLALVAWESLFIRGRDSLLIMLGLLASAGVGGVVGGWRLGGRRPGGWWLWLWVTPHLLLFLLFAIGLIFDLGASGQR